MILEEFISFVLNGSFFILNLGDDLLYWYSSGHPARAQEKILRAVIKENKNTKFGIDYSFDRISDMSDFLELVPVMEYEDYSSYIEQIKKGDKNVLTKSQVNRLCLSSGTTSPSKLIPFTKNLKRDFQRAIVVWLINLLKTYPSLLFGKAFWIITPLAHVNNYESKVPVGFDDDSDYFSFIQKYLISRLMAVPPEVRLIKDIENYYYTVSFFLMKERNLRLISVWNPLVLLNIFKTIIKSHKQLIHDIEHGEITFPKEIDSGIASLLNKHLNPKPKRSERLWKVFQDIRQNSDYYRISSKLWPEMRLISCWTDSWASHFLPELHDYVPEILIQGKGLLATEAVVSIPFYIYGSKISVNIPALTSHFFTFRRTDNHHLYFLHQLEIGMQYEVIVTTHGGLYQYNLNDIVEVNGFFKKLPTLRFIGKSNRVSDLTGEKLNEVHISCIIENLRAEFHLKSKVIFISPNLSGEIPCYVIFIEDIDKDIRSKKDALINRLETLFSENFHYKNSRTLLQLDKPRIFLMKKEAGEVLLWAKSENTRQGTVKLNSLEYQIDMADTLPGSFID